MGQSRPRQHLRIPGVATIVGVGVTITLTFSHFSLVISADFLQSLIVFGQELSELFHLYS
jgi:hypothetical protein